MLELSTRVRYCLNAFLMKMSALMSFDENRLISEARMYASVREAKHSRSHSLASSISSAIEVTEYDAVYARCTCVTGKKFSGQ